jgi:ABC-type Fe3+-hydroxamate transport system substrate-binding protein
LRVVSLVPSLTATLFDLGLTTNDIVGRTPWCIHPNPEVNNINVVGGTKTPNMGKIEALEPSLLVLDRDENPREVYEWALSKNIEVFVCEVHHPRDVPGMLIELGQIIGRISEAENISAHINSALDKCLTSSRRPVVLPLIWHEPLMAVSPEKYAGGLIESIGFSVPLIEQGGTGYPVVTPKHIVEHHVEGLLLSSEPHDFARSEGEAICDEVEAISGFRPWCQCVDGEDLTWMGSRTSTAIGNLYSALSHRFEGHQ